MAGSISHSDRAARVRAVRAFLDALAGALDFAVSIDPKLPAPASPPEQIPVCRWWELALGAARGPLVAPLAALGAWLSWTQNPNYRRRPPHPAFLDNYGLAVSPGPEAGPPALARAPGVALGVLLLGPHTHYPLHAHPAAEVYVTLTPDGEWWRDEGPWRREPPGTAIHHAPGVVHATRAGDAPLLAVYVWRGDLATHARLERS
jgi:hypothetical protein